MHFISGFKFFIINSIIFSYALSLSPPFMDVTFPFFPLPIFLSFKSLPLFPQRVHCYKQSFSRLKYKKHVISFKFSAQFLYTLSNYILHFSLSWAVNFENWLELKCITLFSQIRKHQWNKSSFDFGCTWIGY